MKHESFVEFIASYVKPDIYVELGVYDCSTFHKVSEHVVGWSFGVDINPLNDKEKLGTTIYKETTQDFARRWKNEIEDDIVDDIDLIFIDADHSKEAVLKDVENFWPHIKDDTGLIILHDTWPLNKVQTASGYSGDCYLATKEIKEKYACELLTIPVPYGLSVIRKIGGDWRNG